jgi:hypothetical protein
LKQWLLSLGLMLFSSYGWAVLIPNLYQANVPVTAQDGNAYQQALPLALQQVMVKVSGNSQAKSVEMPALAISQLVQAYDYFQSPVTGLMLRVNFEPQAIAKLLQEVRQNFWGNDRPLLLTWFMLNLPHKPAHLLTSNDNTLNISYLLQQHALRRGVPVALPSHVEELSLLQNSNQQTLLWQASQRYRHDGILIVQCSPLAQGNWQCGWQAHLQYEQISWHTARGTVAQNLAAGMDQLADALAKRYAVAANGVVETITLVISNINDLSAYTKLFNYLRQMQGIQQLQMQSINKGNAVFTLQLAGGTKALQQALAFERNFKKIELGSLSPQSLNYRFNP